MVHNYEKKGREKKAAAAQRHIKTPTIFFLSFWGEKSAARRLSSSCGQNCHPFSFPQLPASFFPDGDERKTRLITFYFPFLRVSRLGQKSGGKVWGVSVLKGQIRFFFLLRTYSLAWFCYSGNRSSSVALKCKLKKRKQL